MCFHSVHCAFRYDVTPAGPGPVLAAEMHYSLLSGDSAGGHGRHLRQVEHVWCTGDGRYAVVLCSDNAVLLYTQGPNAFDAHQGPRSATAVQGGSVLDGWKGSLSVWFQANDQFTLQFGLCYKPTEAPPAQTTSPSRSVVESLEGDGGRLPTDVMVSVAWMPSWKNTDKSRKYCACNIFSFYSVLCVIIPFGINLRWCTALRATGRCFRDSARVLSARVPATERCGGGWYRVESDPASAQSHRTAVVPVLCRLWRPRAALDSGNGGEGRSCGRERERGWVGQ